MLSTEAASFFTGKFLLETVLQETERTRMIKKRKDPFIQAI
jgi:hypothetical protein